MKSGEHARASNTFMSYNPLPEQTADHKRVNAVDAWSEKLLCSSDQASTLMCVRRCPTLPHSFGCSTIGAVGLSFRVRNGIRAFPPRYDRRNPLNPTPYTTGGGG